MSDGSKSTSKTLVQFSNSNEKRKNNRTWRGRKRAETCRVVKKKLASLLRNPLLRFSLETATVQGPRQMKLLTLQNAPFWLSFVSLPPFAKEYVKTQRFEGFTSHSAFIRVLHTEIDAYQNLRPITMSHIQFNFIASYLVYIAFLWMLIRFFFILISFVCIQFHLFVPPLNKLNFIIHFQWSGL